MKKQKFPQKFHKPSKLIPPSRSILIPCKGLAGKIKTNMIRKSFLKPVLKESANFFQTVILQNRQVLQKGGYMRSFRFFITLKHYFSALTMFFRSHFMMIRKAAALLSDNKNMTRGQLMLPDSERCLTDNLPRDSYSPPIRIHRRNYRRNLFEKGHLGL